MVARTSAAPRRDAAVEWSWDEIAQHNRRDDCWIAVDGGVYDVTEWVARHPGGEILAVLAGEDATALFHSSHLTDVRGRLAAYEVGRVRDYAPDFTEYNDAFLVALKSRVRDAFRRRGIDYRQARAGRREVRWTAVAYVAAWAVLLLLPPWSLLAALAMGLMTCSFIGAYGHEHVHGNLYPRKQPRGYWNDVRWGVLIPFMPERYFQYEHLRHHLSVLDPRQDYEVVALSRFVRLSPDVAHRPLHRWQHRFAPAAYGFYLFLQILSGFTTSFFARRQLRGDPGTTAHHAVAYTTALLFHVVLPIAFLGWGMGLACIALYFFTWQAAIYMTAATPHMTNAEAAARESDSWALQVCRRTTNQLCGNRFYDWLTGGFNYQIEHHLLPSIPREHLPAIAPVVEATCREFGYPYVAYTSFRAFWADHYRYLWELGRPPATDG